MAGSDRPAFLGPVQRLQPADFAGICLQTRLNFSDYQPAAALALLPTSLTDDIRVAVPKRQAEFIAGRYLAALALQHYHREHFHSGQHQCRQTEFGPSEYGQPQSHQPYWVAANPDRSPAWPAGFIGSISHSNGVVLCALARSYDIRLLGIDTEQLLTPDVAAELRASILLPQEQRLLPPQDVTLWLSLIFSAKESLFKALYPQVKRFFPFSAAEVLTIQPSCGRLSIRLTESLSADLPAGSRFSCQFRQYYEPHQPPQVQTLIYQHTTEEIVLR
ncbi:MAG: 4'-phosphopantetheinyl transferase superfamily protein [Rheinheimera sp.]|nr:4'-phosphopantetheinyl transferase superfamily protein [Rheinheimera sp.]